VVLHRDPDVTQRLTFAIGLGDRDSALTPAVQSCVVDQVGNHTRQSAAIATDDDSLGALGHCDRRCRGAADGNSLANELGHQKVVQVEANCACVETRNLQEVFDETLKAGDVGDQQIECRLRTFGHVVATSMHHLGACCQRHQGRAKFVTDIAGEAGVALDACLQSRRHVVE